MSRFAISFEPSVPRTVGGLSIIEFGELDTRMVLKLFPELFEVSYLIDGTKYRYYPSSILTALNDIKWELDLVKKREAHDVTLSGYTVLEAEIMGDRVRYYDPTAVALGQARAPVGDDFEVGIIEAALESAVQDLWALIKTRCADLR